VGPLCLATFFGPAGFHHVCAQHPNFRTPILHTVILSAQPINIFKMGPTSAQFDGFHSKFYYQVFTLLSRESNVLDFTILVDFPITSSTKKRELFHHSRLVIALFSSAP
jgi:hypothetical protein